MHKKAVLILIIGLSVLIPLLVHISYKEYKNRRELTYTEYRNKTGPRIYAGNRIIAKTSVNFRKGPGTAYKIINVVKKGESVIVQEGRKGNWFRVTYNGTHGWVHGDYFTKWGGDRRSAERALGKVISYAFPGGNVLIKILNVLLCIFISTTIGIIAGEKVSLAVVYFVSLTYFAFVNIGWFTGFPTTVSTDEFALFIFGVWAWEAVVGSISSMIAESL